MTTDLILTVQYIKQRPTLQHIAICLVGNGVDVWRNLMALLALVQLNHFLRVDWQPLIRVDNDAEQSRVSLHHVQTALQSQFPVNKDEKH